MTDSRAVTLTFDYDNFDRITQITYPDSTFEQHVYNRLDLMAVRDRIGRWTTNSFDANGQLVSVQDPLNRVTRYEWCRCGALTAATDPMGRTTQWNYDVQGRPTSKVFPDGSSESYIYENTTSRIRTRIDPAGQQTVADYYADNTLKRIGFINATNPTAAVAFTYDPDYNRISSMEDGIGTTTYSYYPITPVPPLGAGKLQTVSGPLPNSAVTYQYDSIGRISGRSINGIAQAVSFDALSRPATVTNALGRFDFLYLAATVQPTVIAMPNGETNLFSYYNNLGDARLREIRNLKPDGTLLSRLGYAYDSAGRITSWTNQSDTLPTRVWLMNYDGADQLLSAVRTDGSTPLTTNSYAYDPAGNRTSASAGAATNAFAYNVLNQLVSGSGVSNSVTYEWDAAHRLIAVNEGTHRSEFGYDGLDRRVHCVEKTNGVVASDTYFLWCDNELCEQRDSTGSNVVRRIFPQGEMIAGPGGANIFFTHDHLGKCARRNGCLRNTPRAIRLRPVRPANGRYRKHRSQLRLCGALSASGFGIVPGAVPGHGPARGAMA